MAFLIDIGTGLVGKLVDYTVVLVGRQVGYLIYYNRNVESLKAQLDDLVAASQSVEERVATEKRNIREVEVPVKKWLTDVEKISGEAKEILNDEHVKKKWLCGLCPNLVVRHQLSWRLTKLVPDVAELYGKKDFSTFAHAITPQDVPDKDYEAFGSRTSVVNQIMDVLRYSPDIAMIGVYGIGGVGKTTLVKEVARQATGDKTLFGDVALILDVKQNPSIERIQKEIAEKLGLDLPESETPAGRARRISSRIKDQNQKTLVILDDMWERIDLEAVGLSGVANCKVLLTSRSREVLSSEMHTRKEFPLELVMDLSRLSIPSLPSSLAFLQSLKTLCLGWCSLGDISLIGKLQDLEILSFIGSKFKEFPKEIGQLTNLRLLDLTNCSQLELISPGVISNLERLEELRMRKSFNRWEAEGVISTEKINASLSELKHLCKLSTLYIHILDASILPSNLFSDALERFQIYIGTTWNWDDEDTDLNTLKIELIAGNELYQSGLNMLLKRTDKLHLDGTRPTNNSSYQLDGEAFQQLKHLHVHNAKFTHIINWKGVSANLKKLVVSGLDGSIFLLTSSMARSLVQLTYLEVSGCQTVEKIVSINESDEKHMKDMFSKLQHLELEDLPILTRFCSRSYTGNPSLEILQLENDKEIEERDSREELGKALFGEKVVFPILKRLIISGLTKIKTVWHNRLSQENFRNLETLKIKSCKSLKSVFPSSMVTSLEQLMNLEVIDCGVEEIVANEDEVEAASEFVFPKVVSINFWNLPHLCCFYPGMHASWWPSLKDLTVEDCCKVAFFAKECLSFERNCETSVLPTPTNQALFLINKGK